MGEEKNVERLIIKALFTKKKYFLFPYPIEEETAGGCERDGDLSSRESEIEIVFIGDATCNHHSSTDLRNEERERERER